ncbi:sugar-specific transcriptional regulator TrmB [Streptacidiphilus sp. MAP12-33]|uniref:helix-turn-helix transcriptional regulator n=1 Tax=Streptacidiphilus sp. MAP12-33 TaxID=3156266 RepID=UPI0035157026
MLEFVGLDERAELVYRALLSFGAVTPDALGERLSLNPCLVQQSLTELEANGLAAASASLPDHYVAAPPGVALAPALSQRRHELQEAERVVEMLADEYRRTGAASSGAADLVEVVSGVSALRHRFEQIQLGTERELLALVTEAPVAVRPEENGAEDIVVARGVVHRTVLSRDRLADGPVMEALALALERGQQVRVAEQVPTKLVVSDRRLAMVPLLALGTPGEPAALLVRAPGLLEALIGLFEQCWQSAYPVRFAADGVVGLDGPAGLVGPGGLEVAEDRPDPVDLQILSLLLTGLTDASVAKQLDLGLRTVQRRVQRLMTLTGVSTRLQLGWHAYERGWVAR